MGTNFYLQYGACVECGRPRQLHIGKSSFGWCFGLHIDPMEGIYGLEDWEALFQQSRYTIVDEYGKHIEPGDMLEIITKRSDRYARPEGLFRHEIDDRFCIGHGEGTWDLLVGEFS